MRLPLLSSKERVILELLIAEGEMYGLALVKASPEIKRGSVYVTLNRMIEKGYIEVSRSIESEHEGGLPRRLYKPTGYGVRVLEAWQLVGAALAETTA